MSVIGKLKVKSGGKLKISSGKLSVESEPAVGISTTFSVKHQNNGGVSIVARYSIGLTNTVSYSSGYLLRGEATVPDTGVQSTLNLGTVFVTDALNGDGTVYCYFRMESPTEAFGDSGVVDGFAGFQDSDVEVEQPGTSNGRYELKLSASPATVIANDVEWDMG